MPLSAEEQTRLDELQGKIKALEKEISDCKAGLTPAEILANKDFFNPLNTRLAGYEAEVRELRAKASSAPLQQGK